MVGKNLADDLDANVLYKLQMGADFENLFDSGKYEEAVEGLFQGCLDVLRTKFAGNYDPIITGGDVYESRMGFADVMLILFLVALVIFAVIVALSGETGTVRVRTSRSPLFWWMLGRNSAHHHYHMQGSYAHPLRHRPKN